MVSSPKAAVSGLTLAASPKSGERLLYAATQVGGVSAEAE
jgi:hypothetical protein